MRNAPASHDFRRTIRGKWLRVCPRLVAVVVVLAGLAQVALSPRVALAGGMRTVTIAVSSFSPVNLTVEAGTTIVFDNKSVLPHTATADDGSFDTGLVAIGTSADITMVTPGIFPFHCQFHGAAGGVGQSGTITVTAAAVTPAPAGGGATSPTARPGSEPPSTATEPDLTEFQDLTWIALAAGVPIAVGFALLIDGLRSRSTPRRAEEDSSARA